ncbi:hypothetical protein RRG08_035262 [Elysia crispata]|uniref:Uncharacterized protein n=1 Tax=Elysia crispata TaxID=231223 RepID=A0AAE0ZDB9_9GAST|nr:hypothetical protein RRG08_035262 [Elysia crispata]
MEKAKGDVSATVELNSRGPDKSALVLSWNKATTFCPHTLKCVAMGWKNGKHHSVSMVKVAVLDGGFAKALGGGLHFLTGGNHLDNEEVFTYFHSKKRIPSLKWLSGQPDNGHGCDGCMTFESRLYGLNDLR